MRIPFTNIEINTTKGMVSFKKSLLRMESSMDTMRASNSGLGYGAGARPYNRVPYFPYHYRNLYYLALNSDVLKTVHIALKREIFRKGIEIIPTEKGASEAEKTVLKEFMQKANDNGQSMQDVLEEVEDDINIVDDGYMLMVKDYFYDSETGEIVSAKLKEIVRTNPLLVNFMVDKYSRPGYTYDGEKALVCPTHRHTLYHDEGSGCSQCDLKLVPVWFVVNRGTGSYSSDATGSETTYYIEGEIIHKSKYSPTLTYGYPPTIAIYLKVQTLINQDKYQHDYYGKQRPPKGLLLVNTTDSDGLKKMWDWVKQKTREDPHLPVPLGIRSNSQRGQTAQYINFMNNLQEMQYTEARTEMRRSIGAIYGVEPLFQGDISTSGGLNNEGLQLTVTNRASDMGQNVYNNGYLPEISEALGVSNWKYLLEPTEERDEMAELQRENQMLTNAKSALEMGMDVELKDGELTISGTADREKLLEAANFGTTTGDTLGSDTSAAESLTGSPEPMAKSKNLELNHFIDNFSKSKNFELDHFVAKEITKRSFQKGEKREYEMSVERGHDHIATVDVETGRGYTTETDNHSHDIENFKVSAGDDGHVHTLFLPPVIKRIVKGRLPNASKERDNFQEDFDKGLASELEKLKKEMKFRSKDPKKVKEKIAKITKMFSSKAKKRADKLLKKIYDDAVLSVEKELDRNLIFGKADENAIEAIKNSKPFTEAFSNMDKKLSANLKKVIDESFNNPSKFSLFSLVKEMKKEAEVSEVDLARIARTETTKIANAARLVSYEKADPEGVFKFQWIGPKDGVTTRTCKAISSRTKKGVSRDELLKIIDEESSKDFPDWTVDPIAPAAHYNDRHVIVRVV